MFQAWRAGRETVDKIYSVIYGETGGEVYSEIYGETGREGRWL